MPNIAQTVSNLRSLPDQALQQELQNPSGMVPSYLVLAEAQRRQTLRAAAQRAQTQPSGSVYDDVIRSMMARQPAPGPPAPVGMAQPNQQMRMAAGGSVDDWNDQIQQVAQDESVPPDILREVMRQESHGNPNAMGPMTRHGQAHGLMQLLPGTARDMGVDINDPLGNLTGGARYLRSLYDKYGDWHTSLAAYNAGPGNVDKYGGVPPFRETQNYVASIERHLRSGEAFPAQSTRKLEQDVPRRAPTGQLPEALQGPIQVLNPETFTPDPNDPSRGTMQPVQGDVDKAQAEGEDEEGATQPPVDNADDAADNADTTPAAPAPAPASAPAAAAVPEPIGSVPAPSGALADILNAPPAAPAPPALAPPAAAPVAPTPGTMTPTTAQAVYGDPELRRQLREQITRLQAQADRMAGKPKLSDLLMNLGFGMAAGTSPFFGVNLGLGGQAMAKGIQTQQEEGRKAQLALLGINLDLDKEMTSAQEKAAEIQEKAINQTTANSRAVYKELMNTEGAVKNAPAGNQGLLNSGWTYTPNPDMPGMGTYTRGTRQVTNDIAKLGLINPATQQPYKVGEEIPTADHIKLEAGATRAAVAAMTPGKSQLAASIAAAADSYFSKNPDARPANKAPGTYGLIDIPPQDRAKVAYEAQKLGGMNATKAKAAIAGGYDTDGAARAFLDEDAAEKQRAAQARVEGQLKGWSHNIDPDTLHTMVTLYRNGKLTSRNPAMMATVLHGYAQELRAEGNTAAADVAEQNSAQANRKALGDVTVMNAKVDQFADATTRNMTQLDNAAKSVADLGAPFLNMKLRDALKKYAGDSRVTAYQAALLPVQQEMSRILDSANMSGVVHKETQDVMRAALGPDATYNQLISAMRVFYNDIQNRRMAGAQEMDHLKKMSVVGGGAAGGAPGAGAAPAAPATTPGGANAAPQKRYQVGGREIVMRGNKWVYMDNGQPVQ